MKQLKGSLVVDIALGLFAGLVGLGVGLSAGCTPSESDTTPVPVETTPSSVRVTKFTDGDTIRVTGGKVVRIIGIDTPERGEDCWKQAGQHLRALVAGRPVVLTAPGGVPDHDKYDRLLRYVSVAGQDIGLAQIRDGYAIARYDGLDGYATHPRQTEYRRLDAATPAKKCGR